MAFEWPKNDAFGRPVLVKNKTDMICGFFAVFFVLGIICTAILTALLRG